jgi:serine/threonine-protein kinase
VDATGTVLAGRYRLLRPVGRGGFAAVWEAEHVTLQSKVAIKFLLKTGAPESEASQRFLREARVAASVKHRNVLEIIDFGFTDAEPATPNGPERGVPYMVMELLRGRTLGDLLETERVTVRHAVDIVGGLLRGLAAVHDAGLVHRDIKPHNVFLVEDEDGDFPKLVDFGLSRRTGATDLTAEGVLLGTPLYMAPEQAKRASDLDARVDIYAVGVMLYEMLAGRPPFRAPMIVELLRQIIDDAPPPLASLAPLVPPELVHVVETAIRKDPAERYTDARAMRTALLAAVPDAAALDRISAPPLRVDDSAARAITMAAAPSASTPATEVVPDESAPDEVRPDGLPAPAGESGLVVALRTLVLASLAIGVAVLVLDGPWSAWSTDVPATDVIPPSSAPSDAAAIAVALPPADAGRLESVDAALVDTATIDAAVDDAGFDAADDAWEAGPQDAGIDAYLPEIDAATDEETEDAIDDAGAEPAVGTPAHPRVRRGTPHRTVRRARPPRHRTTHRRRRRRRG